jgi:DNA-binding LytR/AlgR family response regulator
LENIKGNLIKINIDSVVFVLSVNKIIKIHFADKTSYSFKLSLKEFADKIQESFGKEHLLFSTNQRCEMVNLFWLSKYEKLQKKIFLNVLGEEFEFEVTRSQAPLLKDFLSI